MRKPENPCKDCKHRWAECHASCRFYSEWKTEIDIYNRLVAKSRNPDEITGSYIKVKRLLIAKSRRKVEK